MSNIVQLPGQNMDPRERQQFSEANPDCVVTEDAAASLFARWYVDELRYCHDTGAWFEWNGSTWRQDKTGRVFHLARELARTLSRREPNRDRYALNKASFSAAIERFARTDPAFAVTSEKWNCDPMLLGAPDGTVDLRTGKLRPSDPGDGITKATSITPAENAHCPIWKAFLLEACCGDHELIRFLQQWLGYGLSGLTKEHALVFIYGGGGEGKSTFLNTASRILGNYAVTSSMDTFTASRSDKHPTDLAMLRGARFVTASETEEGRPWAEARIKQLTGGDPISARFMRGDFFTYVPQFKLTIVGNHPPVLHNVDDAARRRFNIVGFNHKPKCPDPDLSVKLQAEWPAILRWMIEGCLDWQANGLSRPDAVKRETADYFAEQDTFGQWLAEECDCEPGNEAKNASSGDLFKSWSAFATSANEPIGTQKSFAAQLKRRGYGLRKGSGGVRMFTGIRLRPKVRN